MPKLEEGPKTNKPVPFTDRQIELIDQLDSVLGNSFAEKVRTIVSMYLSESLRSGGSLFRTKGRKK